jgi:DNA polymerase-3 subunit gamma/tau
VASLFEEVSRLASEGRDLLQFTRELASRMRDVYVTAVVGDPSKVIAASPEELANLSSEATAFGSADRIARVLTILGEASSEMRTATNQRLVLEIALTRIARPESDLTLESLAERIGNLERQVAALSVPGRVATADAAPAAPAPAPASAPVVAPAPAPAPAPQPAGPHAAPSACAKADPRSGAAASPGAAASSGAPARSRSAYRSAAPAAGAPITDGATLQRNWKRVTEGLMAKSASRGSLLLNSSIVSDDGAKLTVSLPTGSHFAARMLERADVRELYLPIVASVFGPREVVFVESSLSSQAIAQSDRAASAPRPAPAPSSQPAPAPAPQAAPQQAPTSYPMPWDPVAPAGQSAPAPEPPVVEQVPYSDADASAYEEDAEFGAPTPAPNAAASSDPGSATGPRAQARVGAAAGPQAPAPAPTPKPTPPATPPADDAPVLTEEFANIAAMLEDAFGGSVVVKPDSPDAPSASDGEGTD